MAAVCRLTSLTLHTLKRPALQIQKVGAVECIRGLACLMVLLSHLSLTFYPQLHNFANQAFQAQGVQSFLYHSPLGFVYSGTAAVFIFFVLSGYILTYVAYKGTDIPQRVLSMSIKRYPRLMFPACVSCLLAFYLLSHYRVDTHALSPWINEYRLSTHASLLDAFYTGVVKVFTVTGINPYNPVLWTMKVELVGSLLIFLFIFIRIQKKTKCWYYAVDSIILLSCVLLLCSNWLVPQFSYGIIGFVLGYLSALYGRNISNTFAYLLLFFGLYLAGYHENSASYQWLSIFFTHNSYVLANFLASPLIVYAVLFNSQFKMRCSQPLTLFLGKVSFAAYLLHMMLLVTLSAYIFNSLYQQGINYDIAAITSILVSIPLMYLFAWIFYCLIDRYSLRVSRLLVKILLKH